jgi:hypothetical protein
MPATPADPPSEPGFSSRPFLLLLLRLVLLIAVVVGAFVALMTYLNAHGAGFWTVMALTLVYGAVILLLISWFIRRARSRLGLLATPAALKYSRRAMAAASAYVFLLTVALGAYRRLHPTGAPAYALALAPALPLVATVAIMGAYLREETDEFEKAVKTEGAIWATGGLLVVATVWGFLEMFQLVPHVESWVAFPIWAVFLIPAEIILRRRYR